MDVKKFKELPLVGILRGISPGIVKPLTECVISAGLKTVEITMNTPGASEMIRRMKKTAGEKLTVGAGTVLTTEKLKEALDSGASFIVLPALVPAIVKCCAKEKIPVFPGALAPGDIHRMECRSNDGESLSREVLRTGLFQRNKRAV